MTHLPHGDRAILDIRKIEDYCLNPTHPRGRHKARVFRETLGVDRTHAVWLRDVLLEAVRESDPVDLASDALGSRWRVDCTSIRDLLGRVMATRKRANRREASLLDVVALLADIPAEGLAPRSSRYGRGVARRADCPR